MDEPSTVLTFLFTDIEGSTSKWEGHPEQMAQAVAGHDAVLREAVQGHGGHIVKTTGDGIYAAFPAPDDGLGAVIDIQLGLLDPAATAGLPLRVRCGLHTGAVQARDNDYFGTTINRTARIMGAAHGGQILVSQAIAEALRERLPEGVSLLDLGSVRLKGLSTSEAVFQVVHPRLEQSFPALRELEATPNNLPQQLTSFIGRERECAEVAQMLTSARLLTLLGMGGLGKTRLSLQIGTDVMDLYPDGVWFIDLQAIRDGSLVASETARVLSVREEPGRPLLQTLCAHVKSRKLLLILDNCEQVIDASAELANALLRSAPDVRMLTTSRIALRVPGEQTYVVQPLPLPSRTASFEALSQSTAVQLFVERAKLHKPAFALTEREAPAIAELVSRLEGIPLALELAAARVRSLAVADINKRLNDRYKILTGGDRTLQARQQTLRALVDWSYDLLNEQEQVLLGRLSVFAGSFSLEAAEAVCGADPLDPMDVLDLITSLAEKSLVNTEEAEDGLRYRLLETIRDYSREKLVARGEQAATAAAHCDHFFKMTKAANRESQGAGQAEWTRRIETDLENIRAACSLAIEGGVDQIVAIKLAVALMWFWILRGYSTEGRRYVRAALALPAVQANDFIHGHALYVGACLAYTQGDNTEAQRMLERSLEIRRRDGKPLEIAATLSTLSSARLSIGDASGAREVESEAASIFKELGDRANEAIAQFHLGQIDAYVNDIGHARGRFESCLAVARETQSHELESECELMLGELAQEEGNIETARAGFSRSLDICKNVGDKRGEAMALWWLGKADLAAGDIDTARIRLGGALRAFQAFDMFAELLGCLEDHAGMAAKLGNGDAAVRLFAAANAAREKLWLPRSPQAERRWNAALAELRVTLDEAAFRQSWSEGEAADVASAVQWAQGTGFVHREPALA
ncbi:MAG: adenylate/guanylate cyclase domain-containing protein [Betaproteobacteria bacterium]|nr:adenylate/guanylate cyclase domain-containing protein [Betaproteobacteria bacterium]